MAVDGALRPLPGTEERIDCDGLILSVGLIPENELAESLGVPLHPATKGPVCDQHCHTGVEGIFSCGNALQVNDLVDYVSESGERAGRNAALYAADGSTGGGERNFAELLTGGDFLCMTPQRLDLDRLEEETTAFFRSRDNRGKTLVRIGAGGRELFVKRYNQLRPPEMERITLRLKDAGLRRGDRIQCTMEEGGQG
jgi:hypothetical protein